MNYRSLFLATAISLVSLPAASHDFVSSEKYSDNPMHGVGVAHNAYAGCMAANYSSTGKPTPVEVLVNRCGVPTNGSPEEFIKKHTELANNTKPDPKLSLAENLKPYRDQFNAQQFAYFQYIDRVLANATNAEEADRGLKVLEEQAIKDLGRTDGDLAVLGTISTGRHSLELWAKDRPLDGTALQRGGPWATILAVATADMSGYTSGQAVCGKVCGWINAGIQSVVAAFD